MRQRDFDSAMKDYEEAIRVYPSHGPAYRNRAVAWRDKGDLDRAIAGFGDAIRVDPKGFFTYRSRADTWRSKGNLDRVIADYTEAIRLEPKDIYSYTQRGRAWSQKREYERAIADYDEAIRTSPELARDSYHQLAWLLATSPRADLRDGRRAVSLALKLCELSRWMNPDYISTLAAAYAEAGQFAEAVRWQEKAIGFAEAKDSRAWQERLSLYRSSKRYRDESLR